MLRVLDLFSGIGGFSLGLERTGGFRTVAFCEIEPYCRAVLRKHWPDVPCFDDIKKLWSTDLRESVEVICGGFPCQDISYAGKGAGIAGERSGLWAEYFRLICQLRPAYAIMENVTALLDRGMGRVLGDLASVGYGAEWHCIPAAAIGAPHDRDRVWIIAYADQNGPGTRLQLTERVRAQRQSCVWEPFRAANFAVRVQELATLCGNDDGLPEELGAYGNAVVPQIPEIIGRAILEAEGIAPCGLDTVAGALTR